MPTDTAEAAAPLAANDARSLAVLMIDDDPDMLDMNRSILKCVAKGASFRCETACSLEAGLKALADGGIDVVLLDLGLPDSSGVETVSRLRAQAPDVPVVVVTGMAEDETGVEALRRGAQEYLVKGSFDARAMRRAVLFAVERRGARRSPPAPVDRRPAPEEEPAAAPRDRSGGAPPAPAAPEELWRVCAEGDVESLEKLIKSGAPLGMPRLEDGYTALMIAAESGRAEIVDVLLKGGVHPDEGRTEDGYTALMLAVICCRAEAVKRLIDAGADPLLATKRGVSAVDLAAAGRWHEDLAAAKPSAVSRGRGPELIAGRYEIMGEMGRGSVGPVFWGRDAKLGRLLTIKKFREEIKSRPAERSRLAAAGRKAIPIEHACVARLLDVVEDGEEPCLVMEGVEGASLKEFLSRRGKIPWKQGLSFMTGVVKALAHAHSLGISHGSLSPANILVCRQGYARVTDFKTARESKDILAKLGVQHDGEDWAYTAPEVAIKGEAGPRADIYSLGACFYELLAGVRPFSGPDFRNQKEKMSLKPMKDLLPGIPEAQAIERCLSFDPDGRFAGISELAKALGI